MIRLAEPFGAGELDQLLVEVVAGDLASPSLTRIEPRSAPAPGVARVAVVALLAIGFIAAVVSVLVR